MLGGALIHWLHRMRVCISEKGETVRVRGKAKGRMKDAKVTAWLGQRMRM